MATKKKAPKKATLTKQFSYKLVMPQPNGDTWEWTITPSMDEPGSAEIMAECGDNVTFSQDEWESLRNAVDLFFKETKPQ